MALNTNYGTGRRKTSTARVYIKAGTGLITVNERSLDEFFARETGRMIVRQPVKPVLFATASPAHSSNTMSRCVRPCVRLVSSPAMRVRSSVRKSVVARLAADRSTPSVNHADPVASAIGLLAASGGSSSGRTTDSDSVNLGSNPSPPTRSGRRVTGALFYGCLFRAASPLAPASVARR